MAINSNKRSTALGSAGLYEATRTFTREDFEALNEGKAIVLVPESPGYMIRPILEGSHFIPGTVSMNGAGMLVLTLTDETIEDLNACDFAWSPQAGTASPVQSSHLYATATEKNPAYSGLPHQNTKRRIVVTGGVPVFRRVTGVEVVLSHDMAPGNVGVIVDGDGVTVGYLVVDTVTTGVGDVSALGVLNLGTGYAPGDTISLSTTLDGDTPCVITVTSVNETGGVTGFEITEPGTGYFVGGEYTAPSTSGSGVDVTVLVTGVVTARGAIATAHLRDTALSAYATAGIPFSFYSDLGGVAVCRVSAIGDYTLPNDTITVYVLYALIPATKG